MQKYAHVKSVFVDPKTTNAVVVHRDAFLTFVDKKTKTNPIWTREESIATASESMFGYLPETIAVYTDAREQANAVVVKDVPVEATVVGIPARIVEDGEITSQDSETKVAFSAYATSADVNDPIVKALGAVLDRAENVDARLDYILSELKKLGVDVPEQYRKGQ